jgi:hypothetical protein
MVMKIILMISLLFISFSCKKDGGNIPQTPDPGNLNNKVSADIFVGGKNIHLSAAGSHTSLDISDYNFDTRNLDSVFVIGV